MHSSRGVLLAAMLALQAAGGVAWAQVMREPAGASRPLSARAAAMGDASLADLLEPSGMFRNPAVLPFVSSHPAVLSLLHDWSSRTLGERVVFSQSAGERSAVGAAAHIRHDARSGESGVYDGLSFAVVGLNGAFGWEFSRFWSVGVAGGFEAPASGTGMTGFSGATGLLYSPSGVMSYGLVYSTFNDGLTYELDPAARSTTLVRAPTDHGLEVGINMRYPLRTVRPMLALGLGARRVFGAESILYRAGLEWYPVSPLALRFGFVAIDGTSSERYGVGVHLGDFRLDYAIAPSRTSARFQEVSLQYVL